MSDQQEALNETGVNNSLLSVFNLNIKRSLNESIESLIEKYTEEMNDGDAKDLCKKALYQHINKQMMYLIQKNLS